MESTSQSQLKPQDQSALAGNRHIIYFDGVCELCNGLVDFLLSRPGLPSSLRFCSLQSPFAPRAGQRGAAAPDLDTVVLLDGDRYYYQSDAILRVLSSLGGFWALTRVLYAFPRFVRNAVYAWVARNRYAWFGRRDICRVPTAAERARFLE
ncbi:MAG: DUF393 domain-containing protein [Bdellovibrionales bacterium]|nr:DUF393 domain-containing protein [Bdellovibrionales bacterium]